MHSALCFQHQLQLFEAKLQARLMTLNDFEKVSHKTKRELQLQSERVPPVADILTCTKVNGVKKSHLIL